MLNIVAECIIAVVGHFDCAGNPANRGHHYAHLRSAVHEVTLWNFPAQVFGFYVNEKQQIELLNLSVIYRNIGMSKVRQLKEVSSQQHHHVFVISPLHKYYYSNVYRLNETCFLMRILVRQSIL